mmetsp:Transcript_401/g.1772  ORF Transcript_401/g.1772 Transcript_401/m.1772 type:complete len:237 (+) Transcript_401:1700-2410(+)
MADIILQGGAAIVHLGVHVTRHVGVVHVGVRQHRRCPGVRRRERGPPAPQHREVRVRPTDGRVRGGERGKRRRRRPDFRPIQRRHQGRGRGHLGILRRRRVPRRRRQRHVRAHARHRERQHTCRAHAPCCHRWRQGKHARHPKLPASNRKRRQRQRRRQIEQGGRTGDCLGRRQRQVSRPWLRQHCRLMREFLALLIDQIELTGRVRLLDEPLLHLRRTHVEHHQQAAIHREHEQT